MNAYLTKYAYKNTFTEDLWASLGDASGKPVGKVMTTWTKQMGFPVIKVGDGTGLFIACIVYTSRSVNTGTCFYTA